MLDEVEKPVPPPDKETNMKQAAYDLCYLAACAINGIPSEKEKIKGMNLENLHQMSRMHSLSALAAMTLSSAGVEISPEWRAEKEKAIRKNLLFDNERSKILRYFNENSIWYLPMKGVILKDLYPKLGMREMADNDILYDKNRQSDVVGFMKQNGYEAKSVGRSHHDTFYKEPVYNFELHTMMFADIVDERFTTYYENIKDRLLPDEGKTCGYHMSDDDFYIHMTAHEYKHYSRGGTGLRSLLDRYVYLLKKSDCLDFSYIEAECTKLGGDDFEKETRALCGKVFGNPSMDTLTDKECEMLEYYMFSSTYGTMAQSIRHRMEKKYGRTGKVEKFRYLFRRVFPKTEFYKAYAPIVYKYNILIPAVWFGRLIKAVLGKRKYIKQELSAISKIKENDS